MTKARRALANTVRILTLFSRSGTARSQAGASAPSEPRRDRGIAARSPRTRTRASVARASVAVLTATALALLTAAPAFAAEEHPYLPSLSEPGGFEAAAGTAVDSHGDVYVADTASKTIDVFGPHAEFLTEFEPPNEPQSLAVDSSGDVYVTSAFNSEAVKYAPSEFPPTGSTTYAPGVTLAVSEGPFGVAVDPATQDVYVAEGEKVSEFAPDGTLLNGSIGFEAEGTSDHWYNAGLAVDGANHDVYVADQEQQAVYVLNPTGTTVLAKIDGTTNPNFPAGFGEVGFRGNGRPAVDQSNGDVYVSDIEENGVVSEFTASGAFVSQIGPKFAGGEELEFANSEPSTVAVDNGASSPNQRTVYVTSGGANLYAFGPVSSAVTEFPLNLSTSGTGSGSFECAVSGGSAEPCQAEYEEGKEVEVIPVEAAGSEFIEFNAENGGECSGTTCEFTMNAEHTANGVFNLEAVTGQVTFEHHTNGTGSGEIKCNGTTCASSYAEGEIVHLEAIPTGGHSTFAGWTVTGSGSGVTTACAGTTSPCEVEMEAPGPVSATADFSANTQALTVVPTGAGSVSGGPISGCSSGGGTCSGPANEASTVTLTATPGANQHVTWTSGCTSHTGNTCEVAIGASAATVHADFSANTQTLTVVPTGAGSVSGGPISGCSSGGGTCSGPANEASTVTLTATPGSHQHVTWTSGCTPVAGHPNECEVAIGASAATVHADFSANTQTLTVVPTGAGSVSGGPISGCSSGGGTCSGPANEASTVTLTATPGANQHVTWTSGCTPVAGHPNECEVAIGASAATVHADFSANTQTLTVTHAGTGTGSVTCNGGACASTYNQGTTVTLAATAASGSSFTGWSGAGCSGTGNCVVTIEADTAVTATFTANPVITPPPPPPPAEEKCVVPKLAKKSLGQAKSALKTAACALGKVTKPKAKKGKKLGPLVVKSSSPAAGASLPAGGKVNLKLAPKPKKKN